MIRRIVFLAALSVMMCACEIPPESTAETQSALGQSTLPPNYSWNSFTQPWLCDPGWNPMGGTPWPMNSVSSSCSWQPDPHAGRYPWNVDVCRAGGTPKGAVDIYSNVNYTGSCARLHGLQDPVFGLGQDAPFSWNADLFEVNGWHSYWTPPGGTPQFRGVKSMIVGPQTDLYLCTGPFTGPPGAECNAYPSAGFHIGPIQVGYPEMLMAAGGFFFETAALRVNRND